MREKYEGSAKANHPVKPDKTQKRLRKKYKRFQDEQKSRARKAAEENNEKVLKKIESQKERDFAIDVDSQPASSFPHKRLVPILGFFIEHFLRMARRGIELDAFAEALGYTLHVQNLCQLLREMRLQGTNMLEWEITKFEVSLSHYCSCFCMFRPTETLLPCAQTIISFYFRRKLTNCVSGLIPRILTTSVQNWRI